MNFVNHGTNKVTNLNFQAFFVVGQLNKVLDFVAVLQYFSKM